MKLSIRKTVLGIVAAVSLGFAFPLASPASAGSCSELSSIYGSTKQASYNWFNGTFTMDVDDSVRTTASGCSTSWRYTLTLMTSDDVRRGGATAYGTDRAGSAHFGTFTSASLPKGTTEVAFDHRAYYYNRFNGSWELQSSRRFVVTVPGKAYDSASGENAYPIDSCPSQTYPTMSDLDRYTIGYSHWC